MAIPKEIVIAKIEVVNTWSIQVATDTVIKEDGIEIGRSRHRHVLKPYSCSTKGEDGKFIAVDQPTAIALSNGSFNEKKAAEIAGEDGTVTMDAFNKVVIPGWSLLAAVSQPSA